MIAKRPTAKRTKGKTKRGGSSIVRKRATVSANKRDVLELLAAYQQQMSELEWSVSASREKMQALHSKIVGLQESQAHFRDLFERAPIGYLVHDRAGLILEINHSAASLLGLEPGSYHGASFAQFISPPDVRLWLDHMTRCRARVCASTELTLCSRKGRPVPVQIVTSAIPRPFARPPSEFRSVLVDISHHRAAETALTETQKDYHRLIDTVEGIVWEVDARTLDVSFVSGYAERLLGYPGEEWTRPGFWQNRIYVEDRERIENQVLQGVANRGQMLLEYRVLTADRRVVWLHDNVAVIERNGRLRLLGVAVDVTERHNSEEQLRQAHNLLEQRVAERTAKLSEMVADLEAFSYTLSHDMRSPIRAMQGYAAILEKTAGDKMGPQGLDFVRRIMKSAERLDLLVRDVLNYSRVASASVELKPIPLEPLVDNILHDYPGLAPPNAKVEIQQPLPAVLGHEALVGQVLSNLLTNAVKFMPPGRTPHVRVWSEEAHLQDTETRTGTAANSHWVRIWVEDNGVGIAPQDQQRIFRMFERVHPASKYEGTGIGLAIVQKAIERMRGRVGVQSAPGQGSKFWIELRQPQG